MKYFIVFLFLLLVNCSTNPETYIQHISGYWEIEEVILSNGTKHSYNYNPTIDYISINDSLIGFRKKLKPSFDGSFSSSKDLEKITLKIENDSLHIYYKTLFSEWKETVLNATDEQLIIININKDVYLYKRYQPLDL
jgi:hypothetical protein